MWYVQFKFVCVCERERLGAHNEQVKQRDTLASFRLALFGCETCHDLDQQAEVSFHLPDQQMKETLNKRQVDCVFVECWIYISFLLWFHDSGVSLKSANNTLHIMIFFTCADGSVFPVLIWLWLGADNKQVRWKTILFPADLSFLAVKLAVTLPSKKGGREQSDFWMPMFQQQRLQEGRTALAGQLQDWLHVLISQTWWVMIHGLADQSHNPAAVCCGSHSMLHSPKRQVWWKLKCYPG